MKKEHLRIFMKSFDSCDCQFFASELTLTWLLRDKIVYIMFSFQISGLKQDIEDLEEEYFAEHANFFPLTGTLCIPKQMRQLYCGGGLGGGRW